MQVCIIGCPKNTFNNPTSSIENMVDIVARVMRKSQKRGEHEEKGGRVINIIETGGKI